MNTVRVSKEDFVAVIMRQQKRNAIAKARKEQDLFMEYRKSKTQRLKRYER